MSGLLWFLAGCAATLLATLLRTRPRRPAATDPRPTAAQEPPPAPRPVVLGDTCSLEEVSHAIGTELACLTSSVEGHAQLLCESLRVPEVLAREADYLWESVRRLRFLSEKLQSFSGIPRLAMQPTDVAQLLSAIAFEIEDYSRGSLQVGLSIAPSLPYARANPTALRSAVLFLIECVLDLEPNSSTLLLQAGAQDRGEAGLDVRIDIEAILDEGSTRRETAARATQFSYLAARNLLAAQGGAFTLDRTEGLTAYATITLEATTERQHASPSHTAGSPHRFGGVLLLESNPMIREMLGQELHRTSRNIISCADGVAAESLFAATPERFELLILEQQSRRLPGDEVALRALALNPWIKVLLLTPGPGIAVAPELACHPGVTVLHKPFGIMELRDALAEILGPGPEPGDARTAVAAQVD